MPPQESEVVRVDTGVYEGGEVSMYYDPMIAKLITYGATRDRAIAHMRDALNEFFIRGVQHNISFLAALMVHTRFMTGRISTNMIAEEYPTGFYASDVPHGAGGGGRQPGRRSAHRRVRMKMPTARLQRPR
jgi:propionyl-CoA carboxylase alpha chain